MGPRLRWLAALCCLCISACADLSRGEPSAARVDATTDSQGTDGGAGDAAASFATVHALLVPTCQRCHTQGGEAGGSQLLFTGDVAADLAAAMRFVDTSAPAGSRLLSKMSGNGHGGGVVYAAASPEYDTVLRWIQQGAPP